MMKFPHLNYLTHFKKHAEKRLFMMNGIITEEWAPCDKLLGIANINNYGIIVLNTPITVHCKPSFLVDLWNRARVRITVDGGTKQWLDWVQTNVNHADVLNPDMVTGDMDSLPKEVLNHFKEINNDLKICYTPDQDETDFSKAVKELSKFCLEESIQIDTVFVIVDSSGRFDHIMANINTLFKSHNLIKNVKIFLLGSYSLTWLLREGKHLINIPDCIRENQDWCAILPIGSASIVTTSGLKWNLKNQTMNFGGVVSSSNTYDGLPRVFIETNHPLVWSMSIESLLQSYDSH